MNAEGSGSLLGLVLLLWQINFSAALFSSNRLDLPLRRARDHTSCRDVELRTVPGALHLAVDQRSVRKRATFVRAAVLECVHPVRTFSQRDALCLRADLSQHHLPWSDLADVRDRAAFFNVPLQDTLSVRIPPIDADL